MRWLALMMAFALGCAPPALADNGRLDWPLRPRPAVLRMFDAPSPNWNSGHRGVDLAGEPDQPVYAAAAGTVVFAGELAGRTLVSIAHPGGLRTTYEPVRPRCGPGSSLTPAQRSVQLIPATPAARPPRACTGARCGVRRRGPITSIRWACWPAHVSGSSRCIAEHSPRATVFARNTPSICVQMGTLAVKKTCLPSRS